MSLSRSWLTAVTPVLEQLRLKDVARLEREVTRMILVCI